jgi:hypothetical protein
MGPLPIGALPIGALPIGALPTTGVGGGGWRTGKSAAAAAPATPMVDAITITNFLISDPIRFRSLCPIPASHVPCFVPQCQCSNATEKYFCGAIAVLCAGCVETAAINL